MPPGRGGWLRVLREAEGELTVADLLGYAVCSMGLIYFFFYYLLHDICNSQNLTVINEEINEGHLICDLLGYAI